MYIYYLNNKVIEDNVNKLGLNDIYIICLDNFIDKKFININTVLIELINTYLECVNCTRKLLL